MLRSKDIADYIEARLSDIRPDDALGFDIYLYFIRNHHILLWKQKGEIITDGFIDKYLSRGVVKIWIHKEDEAAFRRYLNPHVAEPQVPSTPAEEQIPEEAPAEASARPASETPEPSQTRMEAPEATAPSAMAMAMATAMAMEAPAPPKPAPEFPRTEEGAKMVAVLDSKTLSDKKKKVILSKDARAVLARTAAAKNLAAQARLNEKARDIVQDVLDTTAVEAGSVVSEIWKLAGVDAELVHAVNVATYAVIFAMAFGRIDKELIADLALAGLLHDVGLSQVPANLTQVPWRSFTAVQVESYAVHVEATVAMISAYAPQVSPRVKAIILQHHEKFDGTGYPRKLSGFKVDDVAQLLSIADVLDSMNSGMWDGKKRTLRETFETLQHLETIRTFPEYFNPEVFSTVVRWTKSAEALKSKKTAVDVVEAQSRGVMKAS
jgi:HD-GYP domain-containing protein (c-di-GMP phosphodiesterase class II)